MEVVLQVYTIPTMSRENQRTVYLPLERLDNCSKCGQTSDLRLCDACGERVYCSAACQEDDRSNHQETCGLTERVDLEKFYPFLAGLADAGHWLHNKPHSIAIQRKVLNNPGPSAGPIQLLDGSSAVVIQLGDPIAPHEVGSRAWWPSAESRFVRDRLYRRLVREGYVLPNLTALAVSLLAGVYTTTTTGPSDAEPRRRVRLNYHGSPISDFGIAKGVITVEGKNRLVHYSVRENELRLGQDPNEYYWLYFKNIYGDESILDIARFVFNSCSMVKAGPYLHSWVPIEYAPAYFEGRMSFLTREQLRVSVLRSVNLQYMIDREPSFEGNLDVIGDFMDSVLGEECTSLEKQFALQLVQSYLRAMDSVVAGREWMEWPEQPLVDREGLEELLWHNGPQM